MAKEKHNFDLNKGASRSFDISKGGKRKFDLTKDVDESVVAPVTPEKPGGVKSVQKGGFQSAKQTKPQATQSATQEAVKPAKPESAEPVPHVTVPGEKSGKKWIWWILAILVIILLVWWVWSKSAPAKVADQGIKDEVEEVAVPDAEITDSVSEEAVVPDGMDESITSTGESGQTEIPTVATLSTTATSTDATTASTSTNVSTNAPASTETASSAETVSDDVEAEALKVIRGVYGVGHERKNRLGSRYKTIQSRVNELKREGKF